MTRILHLSDLHIADAQAVKALEDLKRTVAALFSQPLDIHVADPRVKDAVTDFVHKSDPDVIVITGDITAFGDKASFDEAAGWLSTLLTRPGSGARHCIITPGNHDVLRDQLSALMVRAREMAGRLKLHEKLLLAILLRRLSRFSVPLRALAGWLDASWTPEYFLRDFYQFIGQNSDFRREALSIPLDQESGSRVVLLPFSTVCTDPIWMNSAEVRKEAWDALLQRLGEDSRLPGGSLRIVLAHHNPISSPEKIEDNLAYAYNGMPAGSNFLRTLQEKGVDVVLHGHQHVPAFYSYDFDLKKAGHSFTIGCPSSTASSGGCNLLEVRDVNHVGLFQFEYSERDGMISRRPVGEHELALERNRPDDPATMAVRFEIKRYSHGGRGEDEDAKIWSPLHTPGTSLVYMSGRRFQDVREQQFEPLERLLAHRNGDGRPTRIRILIANPEVLRSLATSGQELLGTKAALMQEADQAEQTLDALGEFLEARSLEERRCVDVRLSHTLLPFATFVRDADRPWGKMALKILPIGVIGEIKAPLLVLNRRRDKALFEHYLSHLKLLIKKGKPEKGEWIFGNEDLESRDVAKSGAD